MLKFGICDFDTSHVVQFTKRLNKKDIAEDQWVDGAEIVVGCPGESRVSPERVSGFTKTVGEDLGVPLVEKPEDMIGKIDAVLIEANDGTIHYERAKMFLEAGVPCFIDKPFAASVADTEKIVELAAKKNLPVFSASSLRYAPEVANVRDNREEFGAPVAVYTHGVQAKMQNTSGWFFYGIHTVEILFALMGPGHGEIQYAAGEGAETAIARWENGAVGAATVLTEGDKPFGFTYFGEKKTISARADSTYSYRELLRNIIKTFETGKPAVPLEETMGIIKFLEDVGKAGAGG